MKMNTKHLSNRAIIKTLINFIKTPIILKTQQTIPYKHLKEVQVQTIYIRIQQIKDNYQTKKWTILLLLESRKSKDFQTLDLKNDFLIYSGAESIIINILTWNEIQTLHPKLKTSKTSSRLATAIKFNKFWRNSIIPCSHSNNGTK